MPMRGQIECIITVWIPVVLYILQLVMVATERKYQLPMLMNLETAQNHQRLQINLWVGFVHLTLHQAQQLVNSAETGRH